ncbi:MAG: hypothetical protein EBZ69_01040 [Alphaproteobacteria bacterium]|nr:hypothetical protein [Alphaproteobacteria bacterium]
MDRQDLLSLLNNFSVTVTATPPAENAQTLTMLGTFLTTVQTTKLGAEYATVIADKVQSLSDNGGQNL